jgi:hypothetical protein
MSLTNWLDDQRIVCEYRQSIRIGRTKPGEWALRSEKEQKRKTVRDVVELKNHHTMLQLNRLGTYLSFLSTV